MTKETLKGYIAAIIFTLIIGLSFFFSKIALQSGNFIDILAHRFTIALISILPFAYMQRDKISFSKEKIKLILPLAICYPILFFSFQIAGLTLMTSSDAGIIQAMTPIVILIITSVFFKDKIARNQLIFTLISVFGVVIIFVLNGKGTNAINLVGVLLLLISVISNACYTILVQKRLKSLSVIQITFVSTLLGALLFNIISVIMHVLNPEMAGYSTPFRNIDYLLSLLYLGIASSLGASLLTVFALSKISAATLSIFGNLATVVTISAGVLFLGEPIYSAQIIGIICILIGVLGVTMVKKTN